MSSLDVLKENIDPLTKRIVFVAMLTAELEKEGFSPVVGGDYAVELYTSGGYKTDSVHIIAPTHLVDDVLTKWNFEKENGGWANADIDIAVKVIAEDLDRVEMERVNQIDVNGLTAYLLGAEDLIIDKLEKFTHRGESNAFIWAQELAEMHIDEIDWDYLKDCAMKENVTGALIELIYVLGIEDDEEFEGWIEANA